MEPIREVLAVGAVLLLLAASLWLPIEPAFSADAPPAPLECDRG